MTNGIAGMIFLVDEQAEQRIMTEASVKSLQAREYLTRVILIMESSCLLESWRLMENPRLSAQT